MAELAVSTLLGSMGNLAVQETTFLCGVSNEVELLKEELRRLQGYLRDTESTPRSVNEVVHISLSQIRDASYEAEDVIELADYIVKRSRLKKGFMGAISRYAHLPTDLSTLYKVGVKIQHIRRKLSAIYAGPNNLNFDMGSSHVVDESPEGYGLMHQNFQDDVTIVGFEDEYKKIVDKLVYKEKMLSVVSIVAVGGAGKTTLARKVHTSSEIKQRFEIVAWVTVSQKFKPIDLLKEILKEISSDKDESGINENECEVERKIYDILRQKRYLVVLDNMWEADTWKLINTRFKAFADASNGSRLLLTTEKEDITNYAAMPMHVHSLKSLDEKKSQKLFNMTALPLYKRSDIPDLDKFKKLGKKLARKCDGLPLSLTILGGYLSKNINTQAWSDVLLGWPSTKGTYMARDIIARSYKGLPNYYLRSCLLYLAAFPEDFTIHVLDLIKLWMAESFIPDTRNHTLEETAHAYLAELAQRNLVQVVQTNNDYEWPVQEIRVHDIVRDWCVKEATKDGFLKFIDETTSQGPHNDLISYRSSFRNLSDGILRVKPNLRTLLGFGFSSIFLPKLRLLRVLHVQKLNLKDFSKVIGRCIHLRYLRLRECEDVTLPSSIGQLLYLQTIDLVDTRLKSLVPSSLWDIPTLRYACLLNMIYLPRCAQIPQNLRELHICAANEETNKDPMSILEKLPCLVVLKLHSYQPETMKCSAQGFPRLQNLSFIDCDVREWTMDVGTMPNLSHLTISKCKFMDVIPKGLENLRSLSFLSLNCIYPPQLCHCAHPAYLCNDSTMNGMRQKGCKIVFGD